MAVLVYILTPIQLIFVIHLGVIALFYGFGTQIGNYYLPPLRTIPLLKIFLIVYVWVALTVWLPMLDENIKIITLWVESFQRGLFYLALTIPFDIRDIQTDKRQQLKTLVTLLGQQGAKLLAIICVLISLSIVVYNFNHELLIAVLISHFLCVCLIIMADNKKPLLYYTGLMDGTIVIQYLVLAF